MQTFYGTTCVFECNLFYQCFYTLFHMQSAVYLLMVLVNVRKKCLVLVADSYATPLGTDYLCTVLCPILRTSIAIILMSYILCITFYNITLLTNFCALRCVYQITYKFPLWRVSAYTDAIFRGLQSTVTPEDAISGCQNVLKWKLVCDLVYMV